MQSFKQIVKSVGGQLLNHPVSGQSHIKALWNKVEFQIVDEKKTENDVSVHPSKDCISLYPALLAKTPAQADSALLREFGNLVMRKAGPRNKARWEKKLVLPKSEQLQAVQRKLKDRDLRLECKRYVELVEMFTTAMDRLVALNVTNALLANGVAFASSLGVDIFVWGPTSEYANLKKYHSIIPFTSAYAPREVHECFGCAFAEMIVNKLRSVKESSTAKALETLIRDITEEAR
jgi:hypothetical protein